MRDLAIAIAFVLLGAAPLVSAQEAMTNRATELRERPVADAPSLAALPPRTPVTVTGREGGWSQVDALSRRGWVPVFHLRFVAQVESAAPNPIGGLGSLLGLGGRPAPETSKVATIGVRGLTREDFRAAAPDPDALKRLQSFRSSAAEAERFAKEGGLAAAAVPYPAGGNS